MRNREKDLNNLNFIDALSYFGVGVGIEEQWSVVSGRRVVGHEKLDVFHLFLEYGEVKTDSDPEKKIKD